MGASKQQLRASKDILRSNPALKIRIIFDS